MGRLFLPGLVVSAENQGTFSDYHLNYPEPDVICCGPDDVYYNSSSSGMFSIHERSISYHLFSSRLSKN